MARAANKRTTPAPKTPESDRVRDALDVAPIDDEPLTAADKRAVTRARRGPYLSTKEVRRKLGL